MEFTAAPVWLIVVLFFSLYWLMVYFDQHRGWFNRHVYMPYSSLLEVQNLWSSQARENDCFQGGKELFKQNCAVCHMENGMGNSLNGCPPLLGSEWVTTPGAGRLIRIVSKGLTGRIEVKGQVWNSGFTMIPIGDQMAGDELEKASNLAAILCYVRKAFGNNSVPVKPEQVLAVRQQIKSRALPFTEQELKEIPQDQ